MYENKEDFLNKTNLKKSYNKKILIKVLPNFSEKILKKPDWIKVKYPSNACEIRHTKLSLRSNRLSTVCEQALCPNLFECFNQGTATFMILGTICTRRCPFCAVNHGRPRDINLKEPKQLLKAAIDLNINHIVITSVVRDDLEDRGAQHFLNCIREIRKKKSIVIEILVPDFRGALNRAVQTISLSPPDIFNHNLENVPRLYKSVRPGANYKKSLKLLELFKIKNPSIPTKSGLMLGLGETNSEIIQVMKDLFNSGVNILTLGQYLQPSKNHIPVQRYVHPVEFSKLKKKALSIGFTKAFCGPFVRSSYHAELQYNTVSSEIFLK
ncbi:lipoyl synthase [Buchnera aphidicola (Schlechtendalia chinensis)]|uniref:Lipoyl synthase n=1 Tax=Buchnera aphidicola subsp. Schlechtendalia chinensis TaxID=118110 RepID=A0A172WDM8_BUCSC|nr:lipoyl synthase [Buchnera aphidicola]ANF17035.1 lipoyl synthase [Buchnera aphidicola (Schlechtendalia chinensis)]